MQRHVRPDDIVPQVAARVIDRAAAARGSLKIVIGMPRDEMSLRICATMHHHHWLCMHQRRHVASLPLAMTSYRVQMKYFYVAHASLVTAQARCARRLASSNRLICQYHKMPPTEAACMLRP